MKFYFLLLAYVNFNAVVSGLLAFLDCCPLSKNWGIQVPSTLTWGHQLILLAGEGEGKVAGGRETERERKRENGGKEVENGKCSSILNYNKKWPSPPITFICWELIKRQGKIACVAITTDWSLTLMMKVWTFHCS